MSSPHVGLVSGLEGFSTYQFTAEQGPQYKKVLELLQANNIKFVKKSNTFVIDLNVAQVDVKD